MIEKGKGLALEKLRTMQLIEAYIQLLIRILINTRNKFRIKKDMRVAKSNIILDYITQYKILFQRRDWYIIIVYLLRSIICIISQIWKPVTIDNYQKLD